MIHEGRTLWYHFFREGCVGVGHDHGAPMTWQSTPAVSRLECTWCDDLLRCGHCVDIDTVAGALCLNRSNLRNNCVPAGIWVRAPRPRNSVTMASICTQKTSRQTGGSPFCCQGSPLEPRMQIRSDMHAACSKRKVSLFAIHHWKRQQLITSAGEVEHLKYELRIELHRIGLPFESPSLVKRLGCFPRLLNGSWRSVNVAPIFCSILIEHKMTLFLGGNKDEWRLLLPPMQRSTCPNAPAKLNLSPKWSESLKRIRSLVKSDLQNYKTWIGESTDFEQRAFRS